MACAAPPIAPSVAGRMHQLMCMFQSSFIRTELLSNRALRIEESYSGLAAAAVCPAARAGAFAIEDVGGAL